MRNPSHLGLTLMAISSAILILPPLLLIIHWLDISIPSMMNGASQNCSQKSIPGDEISGSMAMNHISTAIFSVVNGIPRFIASGLLGYVAVCVGYVGSMHLWEDGG